MQSIAIDLQQVEDHLETPAMLLPPVAASGRAVFDSIRTTLGSIRTRLESAIVGPQPEPQLLEPDHSSENLPQQPSTVLVAISSTALSERLRTAELSHSSRMPLGLLQRELSRRRECSNASLQSPTVVSSSVASADTKESCRADTNSYRDESADRSERDTEIISNLDNSAAPPTRLIARRRTSILLASRRRAEQIQGPRVDMDLHGTVRATSLGGTRSSLPDTGNTATKVNPRGGSDSTIVEESRVRDDMKGSSSNDEEEAIEIIWATLACEKQEIPILLTRLSFSKLDAACRSVLFSSSASLASPDEMEIDCTETEATLSPRPSTTVYSWGQGLHTLHDDFEPTIAVNDALVASTDRVGRSDVVSVAVGLSHAVVATSSGQIMACGDNTDGAVDPDRREDGGEDTNNLQHFLSKPIVIESISFMTQITQVSCGANHTAALRANGAVLTWGSNENGQLGQRHLTTAPESEQHFCRPAVFALGPGRRATQIACGDGFSLVLTSRMGLLACGVECIAGYGRAPNADQDGRRALQLPSPISALEELPLVAVSAGKRHAVVITAHGSAFSWGENLFGQVGREYPETAIIPTPMRVPRTQMTPLKDPESILKEPLTNWGYLENSDHISLAADVAVVDAACGASHTVLVTRSGGLLVCGSNAHGQLGIDRLKMKGSSTLSALSHADAANGRSFVKAEAGANHTLLLDDIGDVWVFNDKMSVNHPALKSKAIHLIAAGGDLCVAISNNLEGSSPSIPMAIDEDGVFCLAESVEELIRNLSTKQPDDLSAVDDLASRTEELLSTPSVLNSLFLDPSEFEDFFLKLIDVEVPAFRQRITLAIEKGIQRGLDTLCADEARLMYPEQVRFLLLYLHCPLFVEWQRADSLFDRRGDLILALCETILSLPYEGYRGLITWVESIFSREDFVRLLVKPLLTQLKKALSVEAGAERRPIPAIIGVLRWFYSVSDQVDTLAQPEDFYSDAVAALPPGVMFDDLVRYKRANKQQRAADFFFCDNPFLFSPNAKRNMLQMESEMNMLKTAASGATFNLSEQTYEINPYYVLEVDRQELLPQTLKKISKAQPNDLRKKLRVVFKGRRF
jgi:alpha-tubulin suppressor-like RCC1 family protein